jgi:endonuclease/exonuclease/phosphatase family metal-dependent hydrolase
MVRLATFNLLHGVPVAGGLGEPERDADGRPTGLPTVDDDAALRDAVALLGADVLGIQEVDVDQPRSGTVHQVRSTAEAMGAAHWRFNPSVVGTPGIPGWEEATDAHEAATLAGEPLGPLYGVGLASRLPVLEWRTARFDPAPWSLPLMIPAEPRPRFIRVADEPRAAIAAIVEGDHGPFTVATAHLSFVPGYNVRQLRALRRWLAGVPRPLVVLGDFNLPGRMPARITGWEPLLRQPTYPSMRPRVQLDHVLVDGLTAAQRAGAKAEVRILPVSDHAAVTVDLDL